MGLPGAAMLGLEAWSFEVTTLLASYLGTVALDAQPSGPCTRRRASRWRDSRRAIVSQRLCHTAIALRASTMRSPMAMAVMRRCAWAALSPSNTLWRSRYFMLSTVPSALGGGGRRG